MSPEPNDAWPVIGRIPSGVYILTANRAGQSVAMLASWVMQCSFEPPMLSVAVNNKRPILDWLIPGEGQFILNLVGDGQKNFLSHFGKGFGPGEPAFEEIPHTISPTSHAAILTDALGHLECVVANRVAAGDHELILAQVSSGRLHGEGKPMTHIRKTGKHY